MCEGKGKAKTKRRSIGVCLAVGLSALFAISAFAASGWVQDRRVTMAQAEAMAEKARVGNQFPVVLNDQVLAELNRYLGTQEGREFMRNALQRLETHRSVVEAKIQKYGLPTELLAIPIVESGYENLPERPSSKIKSAGIWQFIRQTARNFGLKVDPQTDERLNVTMETDAAMRYLNANALRFNDWQLAVQAYNMGEANVQNAIEKVGSRNVWDLIRAGYEGDRHYLAKVHAAILILRNPESLN